MIEPQYLTVGRVLRPHGVRGELVIEVLTDFPDALLDKTVYVTQIGGEDAAPPTRAEVASLRRNRGRLLVRFAGCDDREAADAFRGRLVQIDASQAEPLAEGRFYQHQIIGLRAISQEGQPLGQVSTILETGANDVYVVRTLDGGELLLPAISSVVKRINLETGEMIVHVPEGL